MSSGKEEVKEVKIVSPRCTFTDIRDLSEGDCVVNVKGQAADSVSPTDIWLIELAEGTSIKEGDKFITIPNMFLKYYINSESWSYYREKYDLDSFISTSHLDRYLEQIYALEYENKIYNTVISQIIEKKASPHFIRSFSRKNDCNYYDLLSILLNSSHINNPTPNFIRNSMYLFYGFSGRPSIDDDIPAKFPYPVPNFNNFEYNYILNQAVDPTNTKKFFLEMAWIKNIQEMYLCLFQIVQACYAMYKYRLIHNDLHPNNIWVTRRNDAKLDLHYRVDSKDYYLDNCNIMCRLYDFDRSYCETLGKNPMLQNPGYIKMGQANSVVKGKDLVKVMCYLYKTLNDKVRDSILGLFAKDIDYWEEQFKGKDIYCTITDFPEDKLYDYPQILDNIYSKITSKGKREGVQYTEYKI